ncbi:SpoIID/LytB domain-containing protein [bacterium]|nr:SpoIID/LytB domain-containing protein [bacterium]NBX83495.1 SpoIID/LytB domain-containing protein [bacterium]
MELPSELILNFSLEFLMRTKSHHHYLFVLVFCLGFVAINCEGVSTVSDHSTAVRVLLDKAIPKGKVRSLLYATYYRTQPERGWLTGERELEIASAQQAPHEISVNQKSFSDPFVFIRAGQSPSDKLSFQGRVFRGALKWVKKKLGFSVINYLTLEDYLLGTLGSEMSASWEIEALKAQAVASRTYAHYMIQHPRNEEYDLEKTTQDQVYGGVETEDPRIQEAVRSTRDQILVFNARPIKAFFHSRCGGSTETPAFVWNHRQGFPQRKVQCPYCQQNPFPWETFVKAEELLRWTGLDTRTGLKIEPGHTSTSGRLASLNFVVGTQRATIDTDSLRSHLGYTRLKSAKFAWKHQGDSITFQGVGNGHGVGMCQWGARFLAQQGKNYRQILAHYYPGATLQVSH